MQHLHIYSLLGSHRNCYNYLDPMVLLSWSITLAMFFYDTASALIVKSTQFFYHLLYTKILLASVYIYFREKISLISRFIWACFYQFIDIQICFLNKLLARSDVRINFFQELHWEQLIKSWMIFMNMY